MECSLVSDNWLFKLDKVSKNELEQVIKMTSATYVTFGSHTKHTESYLYNYTYFPSGLWKRILELRKYGYNIHISGLNSLVDSSITKEYVEQWVDALNLPEDIQPRWYQIDALYMSLKYKQSRIEVATRGGKSLVLYLLFRFVIEHKAGEKILLVVPKRQLVTQMIEDFAYYDVDKKLTSCKSAYAGTNAPDIIVGTYQTLREYDKEFFDPFTFIACDESHTAKTDSVREGIVFKLNTKKCQRRFGCSGTQPPQKSVAGLLVESYFGPVLFNISAYELQKEKSIAAIDIRVIDIHYSEAVCYSYYTSEEVRDLRTRFAFEKEFIYGMECRKKLIALIAGAFVGNQLIMFGSVPYCKAVYEFLKEHCPNKKLALIHGGTANTERDNIKHAMEFGNDMITCATYDTVSTGLTIKNIMAIHFPDCGKSEIRIRQSLGRGLCITPTKDTLMMFDYNDIIKRNYKWPISDEVSIMIPHKNIFNKHALVRMQIYKEQKFPFKRVKYNM
jgi:superfamily II DNA or RNA helicase